jgi:accessory gene regulator B
MCNELSKLVLLLIFFSLISRLSLFLFSLCILLSVRACSGGLHLNSNLKCFMVTFVYFSITVILSPYVMAINHFQSIHITLLIFSLIVIYVLSPKTSNFRPITNKKRRQMLKNISVFIVLLWIIILHTYIQSPLYYTVGVWSIFLQSIQLFIGRRT